MAVSHIDQMIDIQTLVAVDIGQTIVIPNTMVAEARPLAAAIGPASMVSDLFYLFLICRSNS